MRDAEPLVLQVLRSGQMAQGPMVERLEQAIAGITGVEHAIAVSSGTAALSLSLQALDLKPGDEVITSPFTFVATLNAILASGATAVFSDIRPDDFNIDPALLADQLTERTKVLLPVSLYGQMADMAAIDELATKHGLAIVEDSAQAIGATRHGRSAGTFGIGCFSLYATKNVTAGEGGVITTDRSEIAERVRLLRNQGMRSRYDYSCIGGNYRLSDIHAAVGLSQIGHLQAFCERRRYNAERLSNGLQGIAGLVLPQVMDGCSHVWHQYTVRVTEDASCTREELSSKLARRGIATSIHYPRLVFDYECYREHPQVMASEVPVASRITSEVLALPVHPQLTDADLDRVIDETRSALLA
ncbi:DegT/DnrJ/EryC1/StrS family aminotransferase [Streptomyces iranensis]|uniref:Perosamine synthetase n=2 Tax=Streptomyces iranensis TaxID=576784 RepID=A0A060ZL90_9ACTN|nr:DegT/DnrJ/EryC1/StrS family aminotransferase [Streptomyces iranensis]CDR02655.1 perosamine synthetase [Streptomyces iranensis]